jgi:hypothetical protein
MSLPFRDICENKVKEIRQEMESMSRPRARCCSDARQTAAAASSRRLLSYLVTGSDGQLQGRAEAGETALGKTPDEGPILQPYARGIRGVELVSRDRFRVVDPVIFRCLFVRNMMPVIIEGCLQSSSHFRLRVLVIRAI